MSNRRMLVTVGDSGLSCCVCDVFWSANELLCYLILHRCSGPHSVSDGSSIFADTFPIHQFLLSAVWKASEARRAPANCFSYIRKKHVCTCFFPPCSFCTLSDHVLHLTATAPCCTRHPPRVYRNIPQTWHAALSKVSSERESDPAERADQVLSVIFLV